MKNGYKIIIVGLFMAAFSILVQNDHVFIERCCLDCCLMSPYTDCWVVPLLLPLGILTMVFGGSVSLVVDKE